MGNDDFAGRVADVAVLADPVRRDLYLFVAGQNDAVSRDRASEGVGVPRHTAKFHLDKLVEQGLLDTSFQRLTDRRGPGAGRPTKLYRRSARQVSVTLPERRYELAGQLMARAIDDSTRNGTRVVAELSAAAAELGGALAATARENMGSRPTQEQSVAAACAALASHGYEPRIRADVITLTNCPFEGLARTHTELVCGMNLAMLDGVAKGIGDGVLRARLDPADDRCCVVLESA